LLALTLALVPAVARGDGDPASDVLVTQNLFLPADAGASVRQQAQLEAVLTAALRGGYPVRVAVIASASDLGSVTGLWRQPRNYAQFLGQELSLVAHDRVLVVMPDGFGLYHPGGGMPAEQAALLRTRPAHSTSGLASASLTAVEDLAQASGHRIPNTVAALTQSPHSPEANPGSGDPVVWGVLAAGVALIGAAWTASLRARPLRVRTR